MKAVIPAAGAATRLSPITDDTPTAMVPVHGRALESSAMDAAETFDEGSRRAS
jgi:NDP-sugar pyrophosphorylase family protein